MTVLSKFPQKIRKSFSGHSSRVGSTHTFPAAMRLMGFFWDCDCWVVEVVVVVVFAFVDGSGGGGGGGGGGN